MFEEISTKYYKTIYNYCLYKFSGNKSSAENVTQKVFFSLYKRLDHIKLSADIRAWLYKAAEAEFRSCIKNSPELLPSDDIPEEHLKCETMFPSDIEKRIGCLTDNEKNIICEYYSGADKQLVAQSNDITLNELFSRIYNIKNKLNGELSI